MRTPVDGVSQISCRGSLRRRKERGQNLAYPPTIVLMPDEPVGRVRGEPDGGRDRHDGPRLGHVPGRCRGGVYGHADIDKTVFFVSCNYLKWKSCHRLPPTNRARGRGAGFSVRFLPITTGGGHTSFLSCVGEVKALRNITRDSERGERGGGAAAHTTTSAAGRAPRCAVLSPSDDGASHCSNRTGSRRVRRRLR